MTTPPHQADPTGGDRAARLNKSGGFGGYRPNHPTERYGENEDEHKLPIGESVTGQECIVENDEQGQNGGA